MTVIYACGLFKWLMSLNVITCRYIFFADKVEVEDITTRTKLFVLVGPNSNKVNLQDTYVLTFMFQVSLVFKKC